MESLSYDWWMDAVVENNITDSCFTACPNLTYDHGKCPSGQEEMSWYDAIAGLRLTASLLSIIGSLSIITSVLYHRRIKSCEVIPIFVLAWADMLLSVFFVVGSAYWYHPGKDESDSAVIYLCIVTSVFTAVLTLISTNLTVVYALTLCLRMKLRAAKENKTKCMTRRVFFAILVVAYLVSWFTPVVILIPEYLSNDPFWRCANSCTCGCQLSYLNVLPHLNGAHLANGTYLGAAEKLYTELAVTLTVQYSIDLVLLVILYGILLRRIFCVKKGKLQQIGDEMLLSDAPETFRDRSFRAVCRILSYFTIFGVCGIINVIVSCLILYHISHSQFEPPQDRKIALLLMQAVTLPLQGFCNALVYGWSRQMFRSEVLDDRTPLIAPAEREEREPAPVSFERHGRARVGKPDPDNPNRRYTND